MATTKEVKLAPKLNAINLKNVLWNTLNGIKDNTLEASNADAIASQSREILRTINTQLRVANQSGRTIPKDVLDFSENK